MWFRKGLERRRDDGGAVAIVVALFMLIFIVMVAFVVDFGRVYATKAQLQNAVDAAALAGAQELSNATAAKTSAWSYAAQNGIPNTAGVVPSGSDQSLLVTTPYLNDACQIQVAATQTVPFVFGRIVGAQGTSVGVSAAAKRVCGARFDIFASDTLTFNGSNSGGSMNLYAQTVFKPDGVGDPSKPIGLQFGVGGTFQPNANGVYLKPGSPTYGDVALWDYAEELGYPQSRINELKAKPGFSTPTGVAAPPNTQPAVVEPTQPSVTEPPKPTQPPEPAWDITVANCNTVQSSTFQAGKSLQCTGSLPVSGANNITVPATVTGIKASANLANSAGSGGNARTLTLASGFNGTIWAGGNVSSLGLPSSFTSGSIYAGGTISGLSIPNGYAGTVYAVGNVTLTSIGTGFNGTIVSETGSITLSGGTFAAGYAKTIWAGTTLTMVAARTPNDFDGSIRAGGNVGTISLAAGSTGTIWTGGSITSLTLPTGYAQTVYANGAVNVASAPSLAGSLISNTSTITIPNTAGTIPAGYTGTLWAGTTITLPNAAMAGAFNGVYRAGTTSSGLSLKAGSTGTIWAGGAISTLTLPSGYTNTVYAGGNLGLSAAPSFAGSLISNTGTITIPNTAGTIPAGYTGTLWAGSTITLPNASMAGAFNGVYRSGGAVSNLTLPSGSTGTIWAQGNISSLTLPGGYDKTVWSNGGSITNLLPANSSGNFQGNLGAGADISTVTLPDGYAGTLQAGGTISNITFLGAFNGSLIGNVSGVSVPGGSIWSGALTNVTIPDGYSGNLVAPTGDISNVTFAGAFTGNVIAESGNVSNLTLPADYAGTIWANGTVTNVTLSPTFTGTIFGAAGVTQNLTNFDGYLLTDGPLTVTGGTDETIGNLIYTGTTGTTEFKDVKTGSVILSPVGTVETQETGTPPPNKTVLGPIVANNVKFTGGKQIPAPGSGGSGAAGGVSLIE